MKICYLANAYSLHVQRWVKYFAEKGHEVHIISFPFTFSTSIYSTKQPDIKLSDINIHIVNMNKKYLYLAFPYVFFQFRRIINDIKPDIVHAHYVTHYGPIGVFSGFHPFVVSAWGGDVLINPKKSRIYKLITKHALKKADLITCDGENLKYAMVNLGENSQKIRIIFHGVDTQKFKSRQRSEKLRRDLEIFDSPAIISLRDLKPLYDVESLIIAIPPVLKKVPEAKFVIAGIGPQELELKKLSKSLGISDSIRFIGWLPRNDFIRCLASADIYVSTSLSDGGIAVSIMEAMACELPVVVTDSGDNSKWIKDGKNGFVVPIKDPKALAEKIIYLLGSEDIRKRFGKINREIIEEKAEYNKEMGKMEKFYEEIINEG